MLEGADSDVLLSDPQPGTGQRDCGGGSGVGYAGALVQQRLDCHDPGYLTAMPMQHDVAGTLENGSWGYFVGTYDKDAGPDN